MDLETLRKSDNIAELLSDEKLREIAHMVNEGYSYDKDSRKEWEQANEEAMKIARQIPDNKSFPWVGCADIKFPLITQAAIDFAAREYPELIKGDKVVRAAVIGKDPNNEKYTRAQRVSKFMSYQLLNLMDSWEFNLDQALHMLPILGTIFKKTYYDEMTEQPCSDLCHPERIVVNYKTQSLDSAPRITHVLLLSKNEIVSRINKGIYRDIIPQYQDFFFPSSNDDKHVRDEEEFLEQCCWLDLDEDGYSEPYVVTQHRVTREVMRIVPRIKEIKYTKDKKVLKIIPKNYYTAFVFIPSPDGGFYGTGLGTLLLPLNKSINTIFNQLIDSGTLSNTQGGFIDSKVRMKNGDYTIKGGEFSVVQVSGMNKLQDYVMPLPTKEPSQTLFQLLGLLISASRDLVSNTDLLKGKGETQNVPATTTMAMIEQGLKVYNAITKRLFLAQSREYSKIFEINQEYLSNEEYREVLDDSQADVSIDFNTSRMDITTVSDPAAASETQRMARAQVLLSIPGLNEYEVKKDMLEGMGYDQEKIDKFLPPPDPNAAPPPEVQKIIAEMTKLQAEAQKIMTETQVLPVHTQLDIAKGQQDAKESDSRIMESEARSAKMQHDAAVNEGKLKLEDTKIKVESNDRQSTAMLGHIAEIKIQDIKAKEVEAQTQLKYQELLNNQQKANASE